MYYSNVSPWIYSCVQFKCIYTLHHNRVYMYHVQCIHITPFPPYNVRIIYVYVHVNVRRERVYVCAHVLTRAWTHTHMRTSAYIHASLIRGNAHKKFTHNEIKILFTLVCVCVCVCVCVWVGVCVCLVKRKKERVMSERI